MAGPSIEFWRSFFQNSEHDIWTIIDRAITIASLDYPHELRERRDAFAEKLFAPSPRSLPCANLEDAGLSGSVCRYSEVSQARSIPEDDDYRIDMGSGNRAATCSYEDAEALSEEMEEESRKIKEVVHIKEQLVDCNQQTENDILKLLKRLDTLQLSFEALKATAIGKPVNALRKHASTQVALMAKQLIRSWKAVADEWAKSLEDVTAAASQGFSEGNGDECGLPSPPIDKGELLAALEMSQFIDFMDNDIASGGPGVINTKDHSPLVQVSHTSSQASHSPRKLFAYNNSIKCDRKVPNGDRLLQLKTNHASDDGKNFGSEPDKRSEIKKGSSTIASKDVEKSTDMHRKERPHQQRPVDYARGAEATVKPSTGFKVQTGGIANRNPGGIVNRKPGTGSLKPLPEHLPKDKLASAKRKLQEGYQQAENAKKQRTVQVMELSDLPKGAGPKAAAKRVAPNHSRPGLVNRR